MDSNDLSAPLLQKPSNTKQYQIPFQRTTLTKPLNLKHGRRKSAVIKQSVRRKSEYHFDSVRLTSSAISVDTGYSEVTERISNMEDVHDHNTTIDEDEFEISNLTKAKTAIVILTTLTSITFYGISFPELILISTLPSLHLPILAIAAGTCLLLTPVVWINEWKLLRYPSMRRTVNSLRREANNLQREINFLNLEVNELQTEIKGMEEGNERLMNVKMIQGKNLEEIVDLVRENQEILDEMREYLRQAVLQDIIKSILRSDVDRDCKLNREEAEALKRRLKISLDAYGVVFDVEKFHRAIGLSPSLFNVITIVKRLLPDENNRLSSFYSVVSDDEGDIDDEEEQDDDYFDMFYIPVERETQVLCPDTLIMCEEYSQKMGRRPTLLSLARQQESSWRSSLRRLRCEVGMVGCDCEG